MVTLVVTLGLLAAFAGGARWAYKAHQKQVAYEESLWQSWHDEVA